MDRTQKQQLVENLRQDLADTVVRLAISHVAAPRQAPGRTAVSITRLLAPAIERIVAAASVR